MAEIDKVVEYFGGQAETARQLGVTRAFISQLVLGGKPLPPQRAIAVERLTNGHFNAEKLNPRVREMRAIFSTEAA